MSTEAFYTFRSQSTVTYSVTKWMPLSSSISKMHLTCPSGRSFAWVYTCRCERTGKCLHNTVRNAADPVHLENSHYSYCQKITDTTLLVASSQQQSSTFSLAKASDAFPAIG